MHPSPHTTWPYSRLATLLLLLPLGIFYSCSLDLYIPIVPKLMLLMHTTQAKMQLTLSLFMLSCGIGQLITGPLSDQVGRRKVVIASLVLLCIATMICASSHNFSQLLLGRILQALACSGTFVVAFSTIRDIYHSERERTQMYSLLNAIIGQSPVFAPLISGALVHTLNWQSTFMVITILSMLTGLACYFLYTETRSSSEAISTAASPWYAPYREILTYPPFYVYTFCAAIGMGSFFMFFSVSPYIIINTLHVPVEQFGFYFGLVGMAYFISGLVCAKHSGVLGCYRTVRLGAYMLLAGGLLMLGCYALYGTQLLGLVLPMMLVVSGASYLIGGGISATMTPFKHIAGSAFACIGCFKFLFTAASGMIIVYWVPSPRPLAMLISLLGISAIYMLSHYRYNLTDQKDATNHPIENPPSIDSSLK